MENGIQCNYVLEIIVIKWGIVQDVHPHCQFQHNELVIDREDCAIKRYSPFSLSRFSTQTDLCDAASHKITFTLFC